MTEKEKKASEKKVNEIVVLDQKEIQELRKMLREADAEASQLDPTVKKKIIEDKNGGKVNPEKQYIVLSTGRWKEIEGRWKEIAAAVAEPDKPQIPSNVPYLATIVVMLIIAVSAIVAFLSARPEESLFVVAGIVFTAIIPSTATIMALMKSTEAVKQTKETHDLVNSQFQEWKDTYAKLQFAQGEKSGRVEAEDRADLLSFK